jgi:hypothetical protein
MKVRVAHQGMKDGMGRPNKQLGFDRDAGSQLLEGTQSLHIVRAPAIPQSGGAKVALHPVPSIKVVGTQPSQVKPNPQLVAGSHQFCNVLGLPILATILQRSDHIAYQ